MFSVASLSQKIQEYSRDHISVDDLEDWFRTESRGAYTSSHDHESDICVAVEAAFSKYHFQRAGESALRMDLLNVVRSSASASLRSPKSNEFVKTAQQGICRKLPKQA